MTPLEKKQHDALEAAKHVLMTDAEPSHIKGDMRVYHLDGNILHNALVKISAALTAYEAARGEAPGTED